MNPTGLETCTPLGFLGSESENFNDKMHLPFKENLSSIIAYLQDKTRSGFFQLQKILQLVAVIAQTARYTMYEHSATTRVG